MLAGPYIRQRKKNSREAPGVLVGLLETRGLRVSGLRLRGAEEYRLQGC